MGSVRVTGLSSGLGEGGSIGQNRRAVRWNIERAAACVLCESREERRGRGRNAWVRTGDSVLGAMGSP